VVTPARITSEMRALGHQRFVGLGMVATGAVCPCHVLVGLVGLAIGGQVLPPAAQDGIHAVYVPFAVLTGALLLRRGTH
jgi:hypothetical protein